MPDYAATLTKLVEAEQAALPRAARRARRPLQAAGDRFYKGDIAKDIAGFFAANGGVMTLEDLAGYAPQWTAPVHTTYRGYDIYSNPVDLARRGRDGDAVQPARGLPAASR